MSFRSWAAVASIVAGLACGAIAEAANRAPADRTLAECERIARADIDSPTAYFCVIGYGKTSGDRAGSVALLERLAADHPESPGPLYGKSKVLFLSNLEETLRSLGRAIELYVENADPGGEAWARLYMARLHSTRMQLDRADAELVLARQAATSAGDLELDFRIAMEEASVARNRGQYASMWQKLRALELSPGYAEADGSLRVDLLQRLVIATSRLGLREASHSYKLRQLEESRRQGHALGEMTALADLAHAAPARIARGEMQREEAIRMATRAAEMAEDAGNTYLELSARGTLARLLDGEAHRAQLRTIVEKSESNPFCRPMRILAQKDLGVSLVDDDPSRLTEGLEMVEGALQSARASGMKTETMLVLSGLVQLHLAHSPRDAAIDAVSQGLRAIESLVDEQTSEGLAAGMLAAYSDYYYSLVGRILSERPAPGPEAIATAFDAFETLRARVLRRYLDAVGPVGAASLASAENGAAERSEEQARILREITEHQIELITRNSDAERRRTLLAELESLELLADSDRFRVRRDGAASKEAPPPATLDRIRRTLDPQEAMLSFMLAPEPEDSWLIAVHRDGVRAYPLPSRDEVTEAVQLWLGLVSRRDLTERHGAARLYELLLAQALADLPDGVNRLVVVPDGSLHHLPFDALRRKSSELPLVLSYEISLNPSATAWLQLRERAMTVKRPAGALIFADPQLAEGPTERTRDSLSIAAWSQPSTLAFSRREGRNVLRALGGNGRLHVANQATEAQFKSEALSSYGLLHFATHAFVDGDSPERSAILLAPGSAEEDGLIQPREVLALDLDGTIVALSACRTAGGQVLPGEGVMSLGRSFLQAGAVAVVGGIWPLGDLETAELMDGFYDRLARGEPVGTAMAEAKRGRVRAGEPVGAWAGVVTIGAAHEAIWPGPPPRRSATNPWLAAGGVLLALALLLVLVLALTRVSRGNLAAP